MSYAPDIARIATPIGTITVRGDDNYIESITIEKEPSGPDRGSPAAALAETIAQLRAYFDGRLRDFDLPLISAPTARGTALRQGMIAIPFGETRSYGELAAQLRSSARAVGQACARNPYPIIVPCHRILGSGGRLGLYSAGSGSTTKAQLLRHERTHSDVMKGTLWAL